MKSKNTKTIIISCIVILVIFCVCLSALIISGVGISLLWPFEASQEETQTAVVEEETEAVEEETPTAEAEVETPTEESEFSDDLLAAIEQVESEVFQIRGLQSTESVDLILISEEELEEIVVNDLFSDYSDEEVHQDVLILSALGLLPDDFDLKQFYYDLYSEQIAGFYDSELKEMYVVQDSDFGGNEKLTFAHEYTHALQDQVYGLEEGLGLTDEGWEEDSERCAAIQALIEGDATLTEYIWLQYFATEEEYQDYLDAIEDYESPILDSAPPYMEEDLYFPYIYGLDFVLGLYEQGGYDAVDEAYINVPVSTEQILHPERYPDDIPVSVELPDLTETLGGDWTLVEENVMGEWYTYLILSKSYYEEIQLPEELASEATEGWGGDAYAFYLDEETDEVVFILDMVWDTTEDADEFSEAFIKYADLRWVSGSEEINGYDTWTGDWDSDQGVTVFIQDGDRTLWVMAPDRETMESILSELT